MRPPFDRDPNLLSWYSSLDFAGRAIKLNAFRKWVNPSRSIASSGKCGGYNHLRRVTTRAFRRAGTNPGTDEQHKPSKVT